ncbi:hypothetical protein GWK47_021701 [Chionoecetes opilio]|uniref:Uncharacterized protein n=1 Tax=Chionoecetes opilio TaxID=41210 RepID=A0A8J4XXG2_CHIOP|nr:hypothetical protein GWK47_021701 [Chionoecetes opilio]
MDKTKTRMLSHELGRSWEVSPELFGEATGNHLPHVPAIYPPTEVNKLRYEAVLCETWGGGVQVKSPPCEGCLFLHALRVKLPGCDLEEKSASQPICCEPNRLSAG